MRYDIKKLMLLTTLSVGISLFALASAQAQGIVSLADDANDDLPVLEVGKTDAQPAAAVPAATKASVPPASDDILFDDSDKGLISPQPAASAPVPLPSSPNNPLGLNDSAMGNGTNANNAPAGNAAAGVASRVPSIPGTALAAPQPTPEEIAREKAIADNKKAAQDNELTDDILNKLDNGLFSQMSDIEKQTALLTLELRKEKIKNDIRALELQRVKAETEEKEREQESLRKVKEWENGQERLLLQEQQKLQELENAYELLRQEKLVKAYKEQALEAEQRWIESTTKAYQEVTESEALREEMYEDLKRKLAHMTILAAKNIEGAKAAKESFDREMSTVQAQVSILRSRLDVTEQERTMSKVNPFATTSNTPLPDGSFVELENSLDNTKIAELYTITEIRGQGENVVAKLRNKSGNTFTVKKGTILQTGHTIEEITQTYIRADKDGTRDYIFFATGGAIEKEPVAAKDHLSMLNNILKKRRLRKHQATGE